MMNGQECCMPCKRHCITWFPLQCAERLAEALEEPDTDELQEEEKEGASEAAVEGTNTEGNDEERESDREGAVKDAGTAGFSVFGRARGEAVKPEERKEAALDKYDFQVTFPS